MDEKEIVSRWKEYFEDLLNPIRTAPTDSCDAVDFGKEEEFTLTEVAAVTLGLKSGEASGENEIRHEMLKTLNEEKVRWLTKVCQVAWKLGKTTKDWQIDVINHSYIKKKAIVKSVRIIDITS